MSYLKYREKENLKLLSKILSPTFKEVIQRRLQRAFLIKDALEQILCHESEQAKNHPKIFDNRKP